MIHFCLITLARLRRACSIKRTRTSWFTSMPLCYAEGQCDSTPKHRVLCAAPIIAAYYREPKAMAYVCSAELRTPSDHLFAPA